MLTKDRLASYDLLDKFKEGDGLHDLASTRENSCIVTGKGRASTAKGWRLLFQEVYQEATDLAISPKGSKLRILASGSP